LPDAAGVLAHNRSLWTIANSEFTDEHAHRAWAAEEITWGLFGAPESDLHVLGNVAGLDVIELGSGTAYLCAQLARQGARPVGLDLTPAQLATGRCQERFGLAFPLVEANAEDVSLPDASFDLVVSEYRASVWCEPECSVAEAARLLRPSGRLVFLTNSVLAPLCVPEAEGFAEERLLRPQ
jgi:SAM-dependent methyltransferase